MFRQKVKSIAELLPEFLRNQGLETPLQQRRLIDLTMNRSGLVRRLNEQVGSMVIADIRFY